MSQSKGTQFKVPQSNSTFNKRSTKGEIARSIFKMLSSYTTDIIKLDEERGIILIRTQNSKKPDHSFKIQVTELGDLPIE